MKVQEQADTAEEKIWTNTFAEQYLNYNDPILVFPGILFAQVLTKIS
jgi:hypothetical protein